MEEAKGIRIASLKIRSGRAGGMEAALRDLQKGNVGVGFLQDTNLMKGIHIPYRAGYAIKET